MIKDIVKYYPYKSFCLAIGKKDKVSYQEFVLFCLKNIEDLSECFERWIKLTK